MKYKENGVPICETNEEFWNEISKVWDYEKNEKHWSEYSRTSKDKIWLKCDKTDYHESYDIACYSFAYGLSRCGYCHGTFRLHPKDSFAQYLIDNYGENALELYWDYEKNIVNPWKISKCYSKKVYIKCQEKRYHESYQMTCNHFVNNHRCPYCAGKKIHTLDSFAQWGIDNIGEDFLEKYWDYEKNIGINPWKISCGVSTHIFIKCQEKSYHDSYKIRVSHFINNSRCPYCCSFHGKVHPLDSLGKYLEDKGLLHLWSEKNKKSPYELSKHSNEKVWWKCNNGKHKDYKKMVYVATSSDFCCHYCKTSIGETKILNYLNNKSIEHTYQKTYKGLIGLKNKKLSYDFYIPDFNLLIEFQGIQHEKPIDFNGEGIEKAKENFEKQVEHDRRKKEHAKLHNISLLEIWYWDYDNIEEILNNNLKHII